MIKDIMEVVQSHKALLAGGLIQTRNRSLDRVDFSSHKALLAGGLIQTKYFKHTSNGIS